MNGLLITVSQLNKYVRSVFDGDANLKSVFVSGEVSNLKINSFSGHMYFTLKDEQAAVKAVMFKSSAARLKFLPKEGMKVICRGSVTVYERDGLYQLYVNDMQPDGAGSITVAFEQLKEKLAAEGLFHQSRKRPIPQFPNKIAVVTSESGAAIRDIETITQRRWPLASLVVCPVQVQGDGAAEQMIDALAQINRYTDCDVIIIGRGGGSAEDLWCFNDERLARAVAASEIPVISAVGHETDFTICDFAADLRAPTPSAAAEIAVPDMAEILPFVITSEIRMKTLIFAKHDTLKNRLDELSGRRVITDKFMFTEGLSLRLDSLKARLDSAFGTETAKMSETLTGLAAKLDAINPMKILFRGYAVAEKSGQTVKSVEQLAAEDELTLTFSDGSAACRVIDTERKNPK